MRGYRGSSARGARRALPVADARLLVNLARADRRRVLLDPFAGAGGIVFEAVRLGAEVWTVDVDAALQPGLVHLGAKHRIGDATALSYPTHSVHGIATEPPFDDASTAIVIRALHDWATLEFLRNMRAGMLADIPRSLVLLGQLLYMHPFSALLWIAGLAVGVRAAGSEGRPFIWIFCVALVAFLFTSAKPYCLAPAYPPLFAMGAIAWDRWLGTLSRKVSFLGLQVATGLATTVFTLPFFSLPATDAMIERLLGRVVPAVALTHDLHDEYGWRELAQTVTTVVQQLPEGDRRRTAIVTANYGQASAINYFGSAHDLPRASTGHMTFFFWGPPDPAAEVLLTVGLDQAWLAGACGSITLAGESDHPLALAQERHLPIHICRQPRRPLPALWPELKRFHHGPGTAPTR
jgi:hypothetical protein